jgi:hypothetical protein
MIYTYHNNKLIKNLLKTWVGFDEPPQEVRSIAEQHAIQRTEGKLQPAKVK